MSLVSQGKHRFYTLTIPSEVLTKTCFVSTRDEDPSDGFQRLLDEKRANEIATYIDNGLGTIPSAIILSAQKEAELKITNKGKTLQFKEHPKAFLILDGQHRVYGFAKAKTTVRVPVVIYKDLDRRDESRIFIDINTQQRPVPNELLLDIKSIAAYETNDEEYLRAIFNLFHTESDSALIGLTSPSKKMKDKITRVTFNSAFKLVNRYFGNREVNEIYQITNSYLAAFQYGLNSLGVKNSITNPTVFKSIISIFPEIASRTKDRYNTYSFDAFYEVLSPLFLGGLKKSKITKPGSSYKELSKYLTESLKTSFTI